MKQVIVQSFCDLCLAEDEDQIQAVGEETMHGKVLDVCEQHRDRVRRMIRELDEVFALGTEAEPPQRPTRRVPPGSRTGMGGRPVLLLKETLAWRTCPECGHVAPTRSATGQHVKQRHSKKLGDYEWPT